MLAVAMLGSGVLAGILAGLLGVGGGIVIVPVLEWAFELLGVPADIRMHLAVGTSLAVIEYCIFEGNSANVGNGEGRGQGGALYGCNGMIQWNIIRNNLAQWGGGGIAECHGEIRYNDIENNTAYGWGGGIGEAAGTIRDNTINNNISSLGGGLESCWGTVEYNTIAENVATYDPVNTNFNTQYLGSHDGGGMGGGISYCIGQVEYNKIISSKSQIQEEIAQSRSQLLLSYIMLCELTGNNIRI